MHSLKRTCAIFAVTLLAALALAAAGPSPKDSIRLVMWGGVPPEAGPQQACDDFNKEFEPKGIAIEYERFVNDDAGNMKLDTNLLAGADIDIYVTYGLDFLKKRAQGNMALDLTSLLARDKLDVAKMFGPMTAGLLINGKPYCFPTTIGQYGIVINKNMFEAAGIPIPTSWTVDQFRATAKKLTKGEGADKVYGMFFNTGMDLFYPFSCFAIGNLGGDPFYSADGKSTNFTDPANVAAVETFVKMMLEDKSAPTHADTIVQKLTQEGMFLSGKSAMTIGPWMVRSIKDTAKFPHDFVTAFAPYPLPVATAAPCNHGQLGDFVCINPKSRNIEAAWTFLKWYAEKGMLPLVRGGRVPSNVNFDKERVVDEYMYGAEKILDRATLKKILIDPKGKYGYPMITTKLPEIKKVLGEEMEAIYLGKKPVAKGLSDAKLRADPFLK
jgi:multiple sugar transport system substrate-binding protein